MGKLFAKLIEPPRDHIPLERQMFSNLDLKKLIVPLIFEQVLVMDGNTSLYIIFLLSIKSQSIDEVNVQIFMSKNGYLCLTAAEMGSMI